jgi:hypothetical protein
LAELAGTKEVTRLVDATPTSELVGWIAYFEEKERRELARQVEALSIVLSKIVPKEE